MGVKTGVEWCHHTFNVVWGCCKVDRGCKNCYADRFARRWGRFWGPRAKYREFGDAHWREPHQWNALANATRSRPRVFGGSMCDPFDKRWSKELRARFWKTIRECEHLDWLLLTKRPENIPRFLPANWGYGWSNVWLLASAHDQSTLVSRARILDDVPAMVKGISLEPLLDPKVDLAPLNLGGAFPSINWIIMGGESGPDSQIGDYPVDAAARILRQAKQLGVPVFHKQFGTLRAKAFGWNHPKGGDPEEWPEKYRRREFPLEGVRRCYICGCHELHACPGGCFWAAPEEKSDISICSVCF